MHAPREGKVVPSGVEPFRDNCVWHSLSRVDAFVQREEGVSLSLSLSLLPSLTVVSFLLASPPPLWNAQTSKDVFATRAILLSLSPARKLPA